MKKSISEWLSSHVIELATVMYAIVEIAGKQYKVEEGRYIDVDLLDSKGLSVTEESAQFTIDKVLLISDGKKTKIGEPIIEGASVKAKLLKNLKDKKVIVYKMRPKKGTRIKKGHRQQYTRIQIEKIELMASKARS